MKPAFALVAAILLMAAAPCDVSEKSIATLQKDLSAHRVTFEEFVRLASIQSLDTQGPRLHSSKYRIDALVRDTEDPSFRIDVVKGDNDSGKAAFLPATAGYPHLTVPMGYVGGLPVGPSFIGPAWSEAALLKLGYAFEKRARARKPPSFLPSFESTARAQRAFAPQ